MEAAVRTMSTSSSSTSSCLFIIMIVFLLFSGIVISQTDEGGMLLDLKEGFENTGALDSSWKEGTSPCDSKQKWAGVACRKGKVRVLNLSGYNLSGIFNAKAIAEIKNLRTISIDKNTFSGQVPDFSLVEGLRDFSANDNEFNGEIVPTFFATKQPSRLKTIDLSENEFSGKIPESLVSSVPDLKELRLQHNEFSGPVPLFQQQNLGEMDLSFNKLEGEIPEAMVTKFGANSFAENPGLCSPKIGKECIAPAIAPPANAAAPAKAAAPVDATPHSGSTSGSSSTKWIILGFIILFLVGTLLVRKNNQNNRLTLLARENLDHGGIHMRARSRSLSINKKGGYLTGSSRKSSRGGKGSAELTIVNDEKGKFGLPDLMRAAAEVLGNGSLGSAYKAVMEDGVSVVVKRLREMNKLTREEFDMEMRNLGGLRHKNILPPLAYHYRKEEKLVVSEYVPKGSLLYVLHGDRGIAHAELTWPVRLKIIKGVAQGMGFLHSTFSTYELPHGNLKSSNILLSEDYEPLLTDYSFHPMFSTTQEAESLFAYRSPEAILHQQVTPKSDVFCLGIVILEVLTGKFPSQYFNNQKGGTDIVEWAISFISEKREEELIDPEITSGAESSVGEMVRLLHIGVDCISDEHETRMDMNEAISKIDDIQA